MAAAKPAADQQVPPGLETLKYQVIIIKHTLIPEPVHLYYIFLAQLGSN